MDRLALISALSTNRRHRAAVLLLAFIATVMFALSGGSARLDRILDGVRFGTWVRPASGRIVVVEMDAASIASIRQWPWSRQNYAQVIDRLRAAGAASITFDVDLSSPADAPGDAAMAAALDRADALVALPTFAQRAGSGEERSLDTLPLPMFRKHVALASVIVSPDADGLVRSSPYGTFTSGTPRPSLSATIAQRSGAAGDFFPIDWSIDPASIPRLSFVAVRDGAFDPASIRGRNVVIGATAIEMGDRYAVPHWGVIPGVVIQTVAAETLLRGTPMQGGALPLIALATVLGGFILRVRRGWAAALLSAGAPLLLFLAAVVSGAVWMLHLPVAPGLFLLLLVASSRLAIHLAGRFEQQRLVDEDTNLPNRRALIAASSGTAELVAVLVANWESLVAVVGEAGGSDLLLRLAERLRFGAGGVRVHRVSNHLLAFELDVTGQDADDMLAGLRQVLIQPVEVRGRHVDATVFLGVAERGGTPLQQLNAATRAAERAAHDGVFCRRDDADTAALEREVSLLGELDHAVATGQIEVHYQPKLALAENRVIGVEALVRWRHPERGFIRPDMFIPVAEQADRIGPLTSYVLRQVMKDVAQWRAMGLNLRAAVNISAKLVTAPQFNDAVRALLAEQIVDPSALIFEVTESATLADPIAAAERLRDYRDLGIAISMDDYGTGHSTLNYLRQLPLAELKIDRSFVQNAHLDHSDAVMVRSTVELAHELGLKVVAEGIEDEGCLAFLREIGCDMAQGYLISRPLPATSLVEFLQRRLLAA